MSDLKSNKSSDNRSRTWTVVVYPDSAPVNWRDFLDDLHISWAESPLHDKDLNPTGEVKKAHYHVVFSFDGKKSFEQICEIVAPLNCPIPQRCHDIRAIIRYFAHLDNPDKFQYSPSGIVAHGGLDVAGALQPSASQRHDLIAEMMVFIRENHITEYQDLADYAMVCRRSDWFPLLCDSCAVSLERYINSFRHRAGTVAADVRVNLETGEIVR